LIHTRQKAAEKEHPPGKWQVKASNEAREGCKKINTAPGARTIKQTARKSRIHL